MTHTTPVHQPRLNDLEPGHTATGIFRISYIRNLEKNKSLIRLTDGQTYLTCCADQALLPPLHCRRAVDVEFSVYDHKKYGKSGRILQIKPVEWMPYELVLDLLPVTKRPCKHFAQQFRDLVNGLTDELKRFVVTVFQDEEVALAFCRNPASRTYHHSELYGLMQHSLEATAAIDTTKITSCMDRQIARVAALLHDIGKTRTLDYRGLKTDTGRLVSHEDETLLVCATAFNQLKKFNASVALLLQHILTAAYPGQYGVAPCTPLVDSLRKADRASIRMDRLARLNGAAQPA